MKPYKEYKDSGIPWIGAIPKDWEVKKLKFLTSVNDDVLSENTISEYSFRYVDIGSVSLDKGIELYQKMVFEDCPSRARRIVKKGDIIISTVRTYLKAIAEITDDNDVVVSTGFAVIRAKNIFDKYLKYVLLNSYFVDTVASLSVGVSYPAINTSTMMNIKITIPTFDTQRRIADYLDHKTAAIDTLIADKQKMIELLKERRQAIISEAVTKGLDKNAKMKDSGIEWIGEIPEDWEVIRIKHLCEIKRGASPRPIDDSKYFDDNGNRFWVRISDVTNTKKYLTKCEQRLSSIGIKCSVPIDEDDFFVSICASVGKPCISKVKACIHDGFVLFKGLNRNLNNYMYYIFDTGIPFAGLGKLGTQLNLNSETIGNIYIPIHKDIIRISTYLDKKTTEIDNIITDITIQIEKLKEYRQAIISEAVTGKVEI